jgi:hypothetical protein
VRYKKYLRRTIIIGLGLTLDKLFLFFLPYILTKESYNDFNQSYYLAGLIALSGALGFNFAIKSVRLKNRLIFALVFINCLAATFIIWLFIEKGNFPAAPFIFALTGVLITIFEYEFLFKGELRKYFIIVAVLFSAGITAVIINLYTGINLFTLYTALSAFSLLGLLFLFPGGELNGRKNITAFYAAGFYAFLINSSAVAILAFGKYIGANNFPVEISNSFIFASILAAPVYYGGNIFERILYTMKAGVQTKMKSMILLLMLSFFLYAGIVLIAIKYLPGLMPKTVELNSLFIISFIMLAGGALFSALHFPLNGILFKEMSVRIQKKAAAFYFIIMMVFGMGAWYFFIAASGGYIFLLLYLYGFLFALAGVKYLIIVKNFHGLPATDLNPELHRNS